MNMIFCLFRIVDGQSYSYGTFSTAVTDRFIINFLRIFYFYKLINYSVLFDK